MVVHFFHRDVTEFLQSLQKSSLAKAVRMMDLLEKYGASLRMPYSKQIAQNMFELRIHGSEEVRLLYTFHLQVAVVLHGYRKKTEKMPKRELALALQRKNSLESL